MTNVVPIHKQESLPLSHTFPQDSELYFTAIARPLTWKHSDGVSHFSISTHKMLLKNNVPLLPTPLAVVGKGYHIVQNKDLFQAIEDRFTAALTPNELKDVRVIDKMSYNGRTCIRDYQFPNMRCPIKGRTVSDIAFRTVVVNGFGGSSVKLYTGAIDMFCTNGMITGEFNAVYMKHTKGLRIGNIIDSVRRGIDVFYKQANVWSYWMQRDVTEERVDTFLCAKYSERMAQKLLRQYRIEAHTHGQTVWALYSALTYYATHNEGVFETRKTDSDHTAATLLKREQEVRYLTMSNEWQDIAA